MDSKDILKVEVNLADRECVISDSNGTVLLRKPLGEETYSKVKVMEKLRDLKKVMTYTPEAKVPNADMTVYEALKEFDSAHKTNYSREYLKIVIDKIPYIAPGKDEPILEKILRKFTGRKLESEDSYLQRARGIKAEDLSKLGLSIKYSDVEAIRVSSELSSAEKDVAIAIVKRQERHNGIKTGELVKLAEFGDDTPDMEAVKAMLEAEVQEEQAAEAPVTPTPEQQAVPEQPVGVVAEPETSGRPTEEPKVELVAPKVDKQQSKDTPKRELKAPKPKNKKKKIDGIRESREAYRQRLQAGKTKKADRPEGAQAPVRETKNERKTRLAREAEAQRKAASAKKAIAANQAPEQRSETSKDYIVKPEAPSKEKMSVRFTRRLRSAADSIRNKVYKPHKKAINIFGAVALAGLMLLAGIKGYQYFNSNDSSDKVAETTSLVQMAEVPEKQGSEVVVEQADESGAAGGHKDNTVDKTTIEPGVEDSSLRATRLDISTKNVPSSKIKTEDAQTTVTASQATVNNQKGTISVESGMYFASPDGTGSHGSFENYQGCKKEMNIIGLATNEGYTKVGTALIEQDEEGNKTRYIQIKTESGDIIVDADNVELAESIVRQNYPDAQYMAIHFEAEHENGERTTLGWVRADISERNLNNTRSQVEHEELER